MISPRNKQIPDDKTASLAPCFQPPAKTDARSRSRRAEPTSGAVGEGSVPFVTSGQNPKLFFLPRKCMLKSAARKREGWTLLLSGDFSDRIEITSENTSGRRPLSRLRRSPSAFYSLSRMLFAAIPTQIGPKAVMHFSVFILEMFGGGLGSEI